MRAVVIAMIVALVLALGALEILAARGVSDADVPGAASVHSGRRADGESPRPGDASQWHDDKANSGTDL